MHIYKTKSYIVWLNPVPKKDFIKWTKELSENKTSGYKKILPWVGIYRAGNKEWSYLFVDDYSPEVCPKKVPVFFLLIWKLLELKKTSGGGKYKSN